MKRKFIPWKNWDTPGIDEKGRVLNYDDPTAPIFTNHCDIVIIGGGAMGCSTAYWLQKLAENSLRIVVVEKDPTVRD